MDLQPGDRLHLERLDAVGELDHLDAAAQARAREVGADLGQHRRRVVPG